MLMCANKFWRNSSEKLQAKSLNKYTSYVGLKQKSDVQSSWLDGGVNLWSDEVWCGTLCKFLLDPQSQCSLGFLPHNYMYGEVLVLDWQQISTWPGSEAMLALTLQLASINTRIYI